MKGQDRVDRRVREHLRQEPREVVHQGVARAGRAGECDGPVRGQEQLPARRETLTARKPDAYVFFDGPGTFGRLTLNLIATKRWKATKMWTTDELASPNLALQLAASGVARRGAGRAGHGHLGPGLRPPLEKARPRPRARATTPRRSTRSSCATWPPLAPGRPRAVTSQEQIRRVSGPPGHQVHVAAAARGDQGAAEGRGHRLRGRLGPDRPRRQGRRDPRHLRRVPLQEVPDRRVRRRAVPAGAARRGARQVEEEGQPAGPLTGSPIARRSCGR